MLTCTQGLTKDNDCYAATQHWLQSAMGMRSWAKGSMGNSNQPQLANSLRCTLEAENAVKVNGMLHFATTLAGLNFLLSMVLVMFAHLMMHLHVCIPLYVTQLFRVLCWTGQASVIEQHFSADVVCIVSSQCWVMTLSSCGWLPAIGSCMLCNT